MSRPEIEEVSPENRIATVFWTVADILKLKPTWSLEKADEVLCILEERLKDRMIEVGWGILEMNLDSYE